MSKPLPFHLTIRKLPWLAICVFLAIGRSTAAADTALTVDSICQKWKEHEKSIQSFEFVSESEHFQSGVFQNGRQAMSPLYKDKPKQPDTIFATKQRLLIDQTGRLRFEGDGQVWIIDRGDFGPRTTVTVIDGDVQTFLASRSETHDGPTKIVNSGGEGRMRDHRILPLRLALRPSEFNRGSKVCDPTKLSLTDETAEFEGDRVLVLKHELGTLWVDPAKDCLPVRYTQEAGGRVEDLIEISYVHDERFGWLPKSWKSTEKA